MPERFVTAVMSILVACGVPEPNGGDGREAEGPALTGPRSVASLWGEVPLNAIVTVQPARVVSPPTVLDEVVFVQDPAYGHGLAVRRRGHVPGWPPPIGTVVRLTGLLEGPRNAPTLWIEGDNAWSPTGVEPQAPRFFEDPPMPRAWTLVTFRGVQVLTDPDPAGRALTTLAREIDGRFGVALPGFQDEGDLSGIVQDDGAVAPRFRTDWTGEVGPSEPRARSVRDLLLGDGLVGMTARVTGVQATPWSSDRRWTVLQDPLSGIGLFVDTEGWAIDRTTVPGDALAWTVQVGVVNGQVQLRAWTDPERVGTQSVTVADLWRHGAIVTDLLDGFGPVDATGERAVGEDLLLDDRFIDLGGLPDPAVLRGVVDDARGTRRLVVLDAWAPGDTGDTR